MRANERRERAARLLCVGFDGTSLTPALSRLLDVGVGGVVLFGRNVESASQVAELIFEIKSYVKRPILLSLDQEGGVVQRLKEGFTKIPPMRLLGELNDEGLAQRVGEVLGQELRAVGVDLNYAPVIDVDSNPDNPVIGNRAFSREPSIVARLGVALGRGIESAGVASCAKHFPGHGDTHQDSHFDLPRLGHSLSSLQKRELVPFFAWSKAGLAAVMSAHVIFEALDAHFPATMSHEAITRILRQRLSYRGLIISDDMEMKAIANHFGHEEAATHALAAGVDQLLCCHSSEVAMALIEGMSSGVEKRVFDEERLLDAHRRVSTFTNKWARGPERPCLEKLSSPMSEMLIKKLKVRSHDAEASLRKDPTEALVTIYNP